MELLWWTIAFGAVLIQSSLQQSEPPTSTYVAAVVEFHATSAGATAEEQLANRVTQFVTFIDEAAAAEADIIVFPESALTTSNDQAQSVPDAVERIVPCDHASYAAGPLGRISCAARQNRLYVVINLTMRRPCDATTNGQPCTEQWSLFNTNVVLDRTGMVISIYRKVNLFAENGIQTTAEPDVSTFETDFGVRFGHFIGFDLMFQTPANELVRRGVRNLAFSSMWFGEMPFLSGVQSQQGWAYSYNVNLLAAGVNNPRMGNSGSGIYAGRAGALHRHITDRSESRLLVSRIPKDPPTEPIQPADPVTVPTDHSVANLFHTRDNTTYQYERLPMTDGGGFGDVTWRINGHSCRIQFTIVAAAEVEGTVSYTYFLVIYQGIKKFDDNVEKRMRICAIVACTDPTDQSTCGQRFPPNADVRRRHRFSRLVISGTFASTQNFANLTMPSTLTTQLLPLNSNAFNYTETIDENHTNVTMRMTLDNDLLTFGVYSVMDVSGAAGVYVSGVLIAIAILLRCV